MSQSVSSVKHISGSPGTLPTEAMYPAYNRERSPRVWNEEVAERTGPGMSAALAAHDLSIEENTIAKYNETFNRWYHGSYGLSKRGTPIMGEWQGDLHRCTKETGLPVNVCAKLLSRKYDEMHGKRSVRRAEERREEERLRERRERRRSGPLENSVGSPWRDYVRAYDGYTPKKPTDASYFPEGYYYSQYSAYPTKEPLPQGSGMYSPTNYYCPSKGCSRPETNFVRRSGAGHREDVSDVSRSLHTPATESSEYISRHEMPRLHRTRPEYYQELSDFAETHHMPANRAADRKSVV